MPELKVNGTTLYWESFGEGPACLCPHGGPGTDAQGMRGLAPIAEALGLKFIVYDHRGHGRSNWDPVEMCTQDQLVADMEAIRQELGLGQVYLLGISWGGFLSLMYASRYPQHVKKLITVGASASHEFMPQAEANARAQSTPEQWAAYQSLWDGSIKDNETFKQAFATIRSLYFHDKSLAPVANAARSETRYRIDVRNFIIQHEYTTFDCRADLGKITPPALVTVGRHDWICPVEQSAEIHRLIPGARLHVFERSGHSPHTEERPAFIALLQDFLAE